MIKRNNKISAFQVFAIAAMIGNSLFVGMGNTITVLSARENTWIVSLISLVIGIIPILFFNKFMNYEPSLNIFEKNIVLFGKFIGSILNLFITLLMALVLIIIIWAVSNFASIKYLTETPILFLTFLFIIPVIYGTIKGIECISRVIEILFFISAFLHVIITTALFQFVDLENLKPILSHGIKPIITSVYNFIVFAYTPFFSLLCIPKDNMVKKEKVNKFVIFGYIIASLLMTLVFFMTMSIVGVDVITMYKYPEYYVIKKLSISPAFDNVENFLSLHWIFNLISGAFLTSYFIKSYFLTTFNKIKVSKPVVINSITIIFNLIITYLVTVLFESTTIQALFMRYKFPYFVGLPVLIMPVICTVFIVIKNLIKNKKIKNL